MTNKDVIKQYVDTGVSIPKYQVDKLSPNLLNTYLRKRIIAAKNDGDNINTNEYNKLSDEQLEEACPYIDFYEILTNIKNNNTETYYIRRERSDRLVRIIVGKNYEQKELDWLYEPDNIKLFLENCDPENKVKYVCNIIDSMVKLLLKGKSYDYFRYELVAIFNSIDDRQTEEVIEYLCKILHTLKKNNYDKEEYIHRKKLADYLKSRLLSRFEEEPLSEVDIKYLVKKIYTSLEIDD